MSDIVKTVNITTVLLVAYVTATNIIIKYDFQKKNK